MVYSIILAAGKSKRMNTKIKKQFMKINDKQVLFYSIDNFLKNKKISKHIIVFNKDDLNKKYFKEFLETYKKQISNKKIIFILGGDERYYSVYNALDYISNNLKYDNKTKILIHDAARPYVKNNDIDNLIKNLNIYDAISLATNINDTIKEVIPNKNINKVVKTVDRNKYFLIKTPQGFNYLLLYKSYKKFLNSKVRNITDDLQIIENFSNKKTYLLNSSALNIKITKKEDLFFIKNLL